MKQNQQFDNELFAALQVISEIAEEARLSVNDIGEAIRQIDVDAASAVTRGHCLVIIEVAKSAMERWINANKS